jgi:hypothetical protein
MVVYHLMNLYLIILIVVILDIVQMEITHLVIIILLGGTNPLLIKCEIFININVY